MTHLAVPSIRWWDSLFLVRFDALNKKREEAALLLPPFAGTLCNLPYPFLIFLKRLNPSVAAPTMKSVELTGSGTTVVVPTQPLQVPPAPT